MKHVTEQVTKHITEYATEDAIKNITEHVILNMLWTDNKTLPNNSLQYDMKKVKIMRHLTT